ncbi:hypothetical protein [Enemella sp. A6]|uniref:hypothetical protein n=1 Tax=Enemella sp. A6 TaxID=3440152 RepID=UPI003EC01537
MSSPSSDGPSGTELSGPSDHVGNSGRTDRSSRRSQGFEIELATGADARELAAIYGSDDGFAGSIAVKFTRDPDPYASLLAEGDEVVVPVARERESGRLVGMGACVIRTAWVNGEPVRIGYLTGLKALPQFRGWLRLIPQMYAFLREHSRSVECYVTTILSANTTARRLLERNRTGMPNYRFVTDYTTHCFRVARARGRDRMDAGTVAEMTAADGRFNLAAVGAPPGVSDADVRVLRDRDGAALAWCAVLDQRATKQYRITGYGGVYAGLAKLPVHRFGYPRLPRAGAVANHVSVIGAGAEQDDPRLIKELLGRVGAEFADRDFVMVGATPGHPVAGALESMRTITYDSRLYDVGFDPACRRLDRRPVGLDVAYL